MLENHEIHSLHEETVFVYLVYFVVLSAQLALKLHQFNGTIIQ
jgi:hypothetical protein